MDTFARRLKELRIEKRLTQEELAKRLGVTKSAISMYERGIRRPTFEIADLITDFFGVSINYLNGSSDDRGTYPRHGDDLLSPQNADEAAVLNAYRTASKEIQAAIRAVLRIK